MNRTRIVEALATSLRGGTFSGVVSVREGGKPVYEHAAGYADRSNRLTNTRDTRFGIASGTKFFTALAIGKLVATGKLSFSTKLTDCLALDLPRYDPEITIRHLLTHTSGIPDYLDEDTIPDVEHVHLDRPWYELQGPRDYLSLFPDEDMKFPPGERFSYSNGGYILLGVVIEAVTGTRFQEHVERAVFDAAGMDRSGFFAFDRLPEGTALGYLERDGGWRTNIYRLPIVGASDGGAYTTVDDLSALWAAFWASELLPREVTEAFATPQAHAESEGPNTHYGYGLWIDAQPAGRPTFYITGGDAGVSFWSGVKRDPDLEVTVISNTTEGAWPLVRAARRALRG